jgi:hypothetical protein
MWKLKKAYDSIRREVLYNILIERWVHMKLVRSIKKFLKENCGYRYTHICLIYFLFIVMWNKDMLLGFDVLKAVTMKSTVLWVVTLYS